MEAFRAARLEPELRQLAFSVLRRLCGKTGYLPKSYLLSNKFSLSGLPQTSSSFADVRVGVYKGKDVVVKSWRVSEMDDRARFRKVGNQTISPSQARSQLYSASVKKLLHGKIYPIPTSLILSEFLTLSRTGSSLRSPCGWSMGTSRSTSAITLATT